MARVPYVSREDLPAEKQSVYDHIEATRGGIDGKGIPNSFRLLLNSPDAAEAVGALGEHIRLGSTLHPAFRETAILGVARALDSQYVWAHHEPIARSVGVRPQVIESIRSGRAPMGLPPKEGVFAQAGKEYVRNGIAKRAHISGGRASVGATGSGRACGRYRILRDAERGARFARNRAGRAP